ncbi:MAG TPA: SIMPL domain-containing protein [Actinomycetota bacterium]|nr:SIMPL domain-containing protein [Actinomycetota bacterium]
MNRKTWTLTLAMVAVVVVALGARAMAQDPAGDADRRTITVSSSATVGSEPDQADLQLGVETEAVDSADALARNGRVTDDVLAALERAGIARDDVQTQRLDVYRRTVDRNTPQERSVFVADSTLAVTVRDIDTVGAVIKAGVGAGATSVRNVRFEVSDPAKARTQALEQAVEGACVKADALADAAGATVTGVDRIVEEGAARPVYEEAYRAAALSAVAADLEVVPPDELDTSVTITVIWTIE